jgi:hypothetical protein
MFGHHDFTNFFSDDLYKSICRCKVYSKKIYFFIFLSDFCAEGFQVDDKNVMEMTLSHLVSVLQLLKLLGLFTVMNT